MVDKERNRRPKDKVAPVPAAPAAKEEGSRCKKHGRQPTSGVCPTCLGERLGALLCPSCNNTRPCGRCDVAAASPALSTSSEPEPAAPIRRTRSAAVPPVYRPAKAGGGRLVGTEAEDEAAAARVTRSRSVGGEGSFRRQEHHFRVRGDVAAGLKSCRRYLRVLMKAFRPRKASNVT